MSFNNKAIKNIITLLISTIFTLFALEAGIRLLSSFLGISPYMKYDSELGWTAQPDSEKKHKHPILGFDVTYEINENGLRGKKYPLEKPNDVYRIMILGDSNGFGWGNEEEKHFAALIDSRYENVQVINLSLSGYGTDQEYIRFVKEGLQYKPDLVIVQVTPNDFEEIQFPFYNRKPKPHFIFDADDELVLRNVPVTVAGDYAKQYYSELFPFPFKEWMIWNSYAYLFINEKYQPIRKKYFSKEQTSNRPKIERYTPESINLFKSIIAKLKQELESNNIRGIVFHAWPEISHKKYIEDAALPVIDLYPDIVKAGENTDQRIIYEDGVHWTSYGHQIIANGLTRELEKINLLPKPSL